MFGTFFPQPLDNAYRGSKVALWLFGLVVAVRIIQSVLIIFNGYSVAKGADGIPLDTFPPAAAQTVVALFALSALYRLILSLLCVPVLVRYRRAIPFMFAVLVLNYLAAQLLLRFLPLASTGAPPGPVVNLITLALVIIGLVLSLRSRSIRA
jgi:hypothetical protein